MRLPNTKENVQASITELKTEARDIHANYLTEKVVELTVEIWAANGRYGEYVKRKAVGDRLLCGEYILRKKEELRRALRELNRLLGRERKGEITREMIDRAKAYPFQSLFEFRNKAARCPFHDDHDPSFVLMKDNTARCFGACSRSWDTIDFVMEREGKTFPEAVKSLQ